MSQPAIHPTASIAPDVSLGENVVIGPNCRVGRGSSVGNGVVIHDGTQIGDFVAVFDNAVLGRPPRRVSSMTRPPTSELKPLQIGNGCVIGACAVLYCGTIIGNETMIADLASIREECEVGHNSIIGRGVTVNYHTRIGNRVKIQDNSHITGNMIIEDGVFISTLVATANDNAMDRVRNHNADFAGPVVKRGASVGAGATLLPGVTIGEYSVVAAGSVVSYDVPARKLVAGMPARVVKDVPLEWLPAPDETAGDKI